jgi:malonyl-CoA O-methyltransferase
MSLRSSVQAFFAAAAPAYGRGNPVMAVERQETESLLPDLVDRDVLDLGAGLGHYAFLARGNGARRAVCLDLTLEMIQGAPPPRLVGDAVRLPLRDESFDIVIAAMVLSYVLDLKATLLEVTRVLRPGGVLVTSDLHPIGSERGWDRSFEGPHGERMVVSAPPPAIPDMESGLTAAGLRIAVRREPVHDERLLPEFRRAGRRDFAAVRGTPLLLLYRAHKRGQHER